MNPGMTADWVLVMLSRSCNASVDANSFLLLVLELEREARKDPEGENTARSKDNPPRFASPMVSLAKSEEPSALQSRMTVPASVTARQAMSAPPAKNRE
jgi:hypothetical protein